MSGHRYGLVCTHGVAPPAPLRAALLKYVQKEHTLEALVGKSWPTRTTARLPPLIAELPSVATSATVEPLKASSSQTY